MTHPLRPFAAPMFVFALALTVAQPLAACPSCPVGRQARSEVWQDNFASNVLVAAFPFLIIGAICVGLEALEASRLRTSARRHPRPRP